MRRAVTLICAIAAVLWLPAVALGHAVLVRSAPQAESAGNTSPRQVSLTFSEAVTLLKPTDLQVVNENGDSVVQGTPGVAADDVRRVDAGLVPGLEPGTYTVRYRVVSADSHIIPGAYAFAIGDGPVKPPNLGGSTSQGPSMTSPWSVSARFLELVCLGGLLGLIAFRWLVWAPAWRSRWTRGLPEARRREGLGWGRDVFWTAFGALAVAAMVAETYLLIVYSASALGTSVADALTNTSGISAVLSTTRLGSLVQVRGALLFALFAVGVWVFMSEFGSSSEEKEATPTGPRLPSAIMAVLVVAVLYGIAAQGHASQAPLAPLQIAADLVHMCGAAVWGGGLAVTTAALWRLPTRMEAGADVAGTAVLSRFSKAAFWAVAVIIASGAIRTLGEIDAPEDLWQTSWGKVLVAKVALLALIGPVALRNRRVVNTVERRDAPSPAGLRMVRRAAVIEIAVSLALVVLAALLVAEVPGRV